MPNRSPVAPMNLPYEKVTIDQWSLEAFIKDGGPLFRHYKALPCPIGQIEKESVRSPHGEHNDCANGFIYELAGEFRATFTSNAAALQLTDMGILDGSTAIVTVPRFYDDKPDQQVYINTYDKLYIKENIVLSTYSEKIESSITGVDKLSFPVEEVEVIIDNTGKRYSQGTHFNIVKGHIVWTGDERPGYDPSLEKGTLYAIRYLYIPYYYVSRLLHEIRIIATSDLEGNLMHKRGPYQISIVREKFFAKQQISEGQPTTPSTVSQPSSGMFGAK